MKRESLDKLISIRLTPKYYAALESRAYAQNLDRTKYARSLLISALELEPEHNDISSQILSIMTKQMEEGQALRSILFNIFGALASGKPLTTEWLENVCKHADAIKGERAQSVLRSSTTTKTQATE